MANKTADRPLINPESTSMLPIMSALYFPMFLMSEFGNGFVIYSLLYLKRRHHTAIDRYTLSLATADFLLTTLTVFNGLEYLHNEWMLGEVFCKIHGTLVELSYIVSTLTIATISYTRSKAVNNPFKMLHEGKKTKKTIIYIWLTGLTLSSPLAYAYTVAGRNGNLHCSNTNFGVRTRQIYYLFQATVLFFAPVSVMIVSQKKITRGLRQHSSNNQTVMASNDRNLSRMLRNERQIRKLLTCLWVMFVCCFTPYIVMRTIDHFTSMRKTSKISNQIWYITQLLVVLNSSVNPYLYYRMTNRRGTFTQHILKLFCCQSSIW
ncbi:tachykinin-like peptides receptor 86C [Dendronephthya gigantea]|uniref:tachykinin-like peptides receptor 86C n=1 Tax=Dendronephthya gigantea TaxID=151771 RepID=UPI00106C6A28|nr:tachykinin-like peptides receptor 86C [Dendronephthya gigantea]